ncbi:MAG: helix-turn-helix transcriptional regulator [Flavobacterium sp.]
MMINIEHGTLDTLHQNLNQKLKGRFKKNGYEYNSIILKNKLSLLVESFQFGNGFNFTSIIGDIQSPLELEINEDNVNYLRFFIVKSGKLIHTLSPSIRYRLNSSFSSMVGIKGKNNQKLTFPVQNNIELFFLQVDTKKYAIDLKSDFFETSKDVKVQREKNEIEDYFIFQSNYSYTISETISEIINTTKTGITKRFFLESKALELLWLHTEQYNHERKFGYDDHDFKKIDLELLKRAKEFIHVHYNQEITLGLLAKEVGTNETKIKQGFKKIYGKTFSEILRHERLNKAKLLLEDGELNIKETALLCGYKSTSMFTVRFKERFGTTPSNFKSSQSDVFVSQSEVL